MQAPSTPVASDNASSHGGGSASTPNARAGMALSVTQGFSRAGTAMMQKITDKATPNLELQVLLLETIESYKSEQERASSQNLTIQQAISQEKERKKRMVAPAETTMVLVIDPNLLLRRGQLQYANWVKKLLMEASQCLLLVHHFSQTTYH